MVYVYSTRHSRGELSELKRTRREQSRGEQRKWCCVGAGAVAPDANWGGGRKIPSGKKVQSVSNNKAEDRLA